MATVVIFVQAVFRASIAPAISMWLRITPPKIVPAPLVSRGSIPIRIAGSPRSSFVINQRVRITLRRRNSSINRFVLMSMVRTAHQRSRFNIAETEFQSESLEFIKLFRRVEFLNRQMAHRRTQILADGHNLAVCRMQ